MIPAIGYMIGAYIVLRCVEILSLPQQHFANRIGGSITRIVAMLVLVLVPLLVYTIAQSELSMPATIRR